MPWTCDSVIHTQQLRLREGGLGLLLGVDELCSRGLPSGTRITYRAVTAQECSSASLIAVLSTSSPIGPIFIGTRIRV